MAASRWKRFAFFDRNTLACPNEVVQDLNPRVDVNLSRRLSTLDEGEAISMVVSTAALPIATKPVLVQGVRDKLKADADVSALDDMWATLSACMEPPIQDGTLQLPSQAQIIEGNVTSSSGIALDGLVLIFLASQESDRVHCLDVTVRCNPPSNRNSVPVSPEEDSLDGWRGYWSPFEVEKPALTAATSSTRVEDRIASEHMETSTAKVSEGIVDMATCREPGSKLLVACLAKTNLIVCEDPHLGLSCRIPLTSKVSHDAILYRIANPWNEVQNGRGQCVDITPGFVSVGTDIGVVHVYAIQKTFLRSALTIPSPGLNQQVTSLRFSVTQTKVSLFVCYHHRNAASIAGGPRNTGSKGICCYDLGIPNSTSLSPPLARHDLDSRPVLSSRLCDAVPNPSTGHLHFLVARADGLYSYSQTQKVGVSPIDGIKLAICNIPSHTKATENEGSRENIIGSSYTLVASTDAKSGRDAIDVYDTTNKLVAFHVLLSPAQKALQAAGVSTPHTKAADGHMCGGRSSAIILTSGGALVTLTEKITTEKVSLLTQKNLYGAAISMAYEDPSYRPAEIAALYRNHAEHLYRKGDFNAAMEQYIYTIGSLEPSHVIFRYLDAPKIPMLTKYLEELRTRELATPVFNELLRTCYLKLGDTEAADRTAASVSSASDRDSCAGIVASLSHNPKEALATVCTFEAPQAVEALVVYGAALARAMPRETAGIVVSLCLGTYSPSAMVAAASKASSEASRILKYPTDDRERQCTPYPVHLFAPSFLESPKMLRLILAHCNRNKCPLTPTLRRTLLELTLAEWNHAKRCGDTEAEKLRRKEAITALTDAHCRDIGDYDALVLVQLAEFTEGELLLYERLLMVPMLLARYAQDGGDRARRQMLAMCRNDPEILADVLGHLVKIACDKVNHESVDDSSVASEEEEILDDIREALALARAQGVLPPVRIARILAGEGTGQFSVERTVAEKDKRTIPLSVALDYVGDILDESMAEISRLRAEVEEYTNLCNSMETEVEALLKCQNAESTPGKWETAIDNTKLDIDELHSRLHAAIDEGPAIENRTLQSKEVFWREMNQSDDRFGTIARYFAKGLIQ